MEWDSLRGVAKHRVIQFLFSQVYMIRPRDFRWARGRVSTLRASLDSLKAYRERQRKAENFGD